MDGDDAAHRVAVAGGCAGMGCERVVVLGDSVVVLLVVWGGVCGPPLYLA